MNQLHVNIPWATWRTIVGLLPALEGELKVLERLLQVLAELLTRQEVTQEGQADDPDA